MQPKQTKVDTRMQIRCRLVCERVSRSNIS